MVVGDVPESDKADTKQNAEDDFFADFGNPKPKAAPVASPPPPPVAAPVPHISAPVTQVSPRTLSPDSQLLHSSPATTTLPQSIPPPQPAPFTPMPFAAAPVETSVAAPAKKGGKLGTKLGVKKAVLDFDAIEKQAKEEEERTRQQLNEQQVAAALAQSKQNAAAAAQMQSPTSTSTVVKQQPFATSLFTSCP